MTYQCDAPLLGGLDDLMARGLDSSHRVLIKRASATVTSSDDYARNSRLKDVFAAAGSVAIPATSIDRAGGYRRYAIEGRRQVGFLGRPTSPAALVDELGRLGAKKND